MSKILYEVYQNDIKDSESVMFGKWYARLKSIETLNTERLAKHISEHGSVFTADVVEGVMKKVKTCLLEMLLESKKVKIAGLGTFYLTCECQKGGTDNTGAVPIPAAVATTPAVMTTATTALTRIRATGTTVTRKWAGITEDAGLLYVQYYCRLDIAHD